MLNFHLPSSRRPALRQIMVRAIGLCLCGCLCAMAASAGDSTLYRWVDDNGAVHYTDKPHGKAQAIDIRSRRTDAAAVQQRNAAATEQALAVAEQDEANATQSEQRAANTQDEQKRKAANCARARTALAQLGTARRPYRIDEQGEHQYLSSEQIDQERVDAEAAIQEFCL